MKESEGLTLNFGGLSVPSGGCPQMPQPHLQNSSIRPKMTSTVFLCWQSFNLQREPCIPRNSYFSVDLDHLVC
jgi:hypothetical protein